MILYYEVKYLDDWNNQHIAFAQNIKEVNFLKNRFDVLSVNSVLGRIHNI